MQVTQDRKLLIAIGRSRKATLWQNKEILWSELLDKLATTTRTRESASEYARLSKTERDSIKDIGGFVGGYLKNGKRSNASIVNRCLVCLDADYGDAELRSDLELTCPFTYALYSTHSHSPEKPRYRIIIPLDRDVTPDEYAAISRRLADNLTLSRFDPTTFEAARLMYWPSTPEDGEYIFDYGPGPFCSADAILETYADWHDSTLWPTTQPQDERIHSNIKKAGDPLTKHGIIGAFCRAHTISQLLETLLKDKYTPTRQEDRYTYVDGTTTGGLVVYDDKFAFSHHATDPASGKLCNAFDLVRWHFFAPGTVSMDGHSVKDEKASIAMMQEYAAKDPETRIQLAKDRQEELMSDFTPLEPTGPAMQETSQDNMQDDNPAPTSEATDPNEWLGKLEYDKSGNVKNTLVNLLLILQHDPMLKGIVFNQLSDGMEIRDDIAPVPWKHPSKFWRDADDNQVISYIEQRYGSFSLRNYSIAIGKVSDDRSYHPIREYLASLPPWDGAHRVDTLLIDYLGSPDNPYVRSGLRSCRSHSRSLVSLLHLHDLLSLAILQRVDTILTGERPAGLDPGRICRIRTKPAIRCEVQLFLISAVVADDVAILQFCAVLVEVTVGAILLDDGRHGILHARSPPSRCYISLEYSCKSRVSSPWPPLSYISLANSEKPCIYLLCFHSSARIIYIFFIYHSEY